MSIETCTNTVFQPKTYQKTFAGSLACLNRRITKLQTTYFTYPQKAATAGGATVTVTAPRPVQAAPETVMKGREGTCSK